MKGISAFYCVVIYKSMSFYFSSPSLCMCQFTVTSGLAAKIGVVSRKCLIKSLIYREITVKFRELQRQRECSSFARALWVKWNGTDMSQKREFAGWFPVLVSHSQQTVHGTAGAKQILHDECQVKTVLVSERGVLGAAGFCWPLNRFFFLYIPWFLKVINSY